MLRNEPMFFLFQKKLKQPLIGPFSNNLLLVLYKGLKMDLGQYRFIDKHEILHTASFTYHVKVFITSFRSIVLRESEAINLQDIQTFIIIILGGERFYVSRFISEGEMVARFLSGVGGWVITSFYVWGKYDRKIFYRGDGETIARFVSEDTLIKGLL